MRGKINPNVIEKIIRKAVALFVTKLVSKAAGAFGPIETISMRPVAALNRKNPGINETTAEKATAAKGKRKRLTTGVTMTLTRMQATSAPVGRLPPVKEISAQRTA